MFFQRRLGFLSLCKTTNFTCLFDCRADGTFLTRGLEPYTGSPSVLLEDVETPRFRTKHVDLPGTNNYRTDPTGVHGGVS